MGLDGIDIGADGTMSSSVLGRNAGCHEAYTGESMVPAIRGIKLRYNNQTGGCISMNGAIGWTKQLMMKWAWTRPEKQTG